MHDHTCGCGHDYEHEEDHDCCGAHGHNAGDGCGCGHDHAHAHDHAAGDSCGHGHAHAHTRTVPNANEELLASGWLMPNRVAAPEVPPPANEFDFAWNGETLHVYQWGEPGAIPVVALHGFMQTGMSWAAVAGVLSADHCVYALDFTGHGKSSKPTAPEPYSYDAAVSSVQAFLREVACSNGQRRAHLLGYSMGGRVAAGVAAKERDCLYSLVLESCNLGPATEADRTAAQNRNNGWAAQLRVDGIAPFVEYWEQLPLFATQRELGFDSVLREERLANDAEAMALCLEGAGKHAMPLEDEAFAMLSATWVPIKYLWGHEDAKSQPIAHRFEHEGFDVTSFSTGHNVHLEAPALYTKAVQQFLSGIEPKAL